jgi:hypothetical protein
MEHHSGWFTRLSPSLHLLSNPSCYKRLFSSFTLCCGSVNSTDPTDDTRSMSSLPKSTASGAAPAPPGPSLKNTLKLDSHTINTPQCHMVEDTPQNTMLPTKLDSSFTAEHPHNYFLHWRTGASMAGGQARSARCSHHVRAQSHRCCCC